MDLSELRALVAVADVGSVEAAARALDVDRSTLRRRIYALEARVGRALLVRDHTGAELTPVGTVLVEKGRTLVRDADRLLAIGRGTLEPAGQLTIVSAAGMPCQAYTLVQQMAVNLMPDVLLRRHESDAPLPGAWEAADVIVHWEPSEPGGDQPSPRMSRLARA